MEQKINIAESQNISIISANRDYMMYKTGFLTLLYNQQEEITLSLFLSITSIKEPDVLQSVFSEITLTIAECYKEIYGRVENILVYDFDRFSFYEYGLSKEEIYPFTEDEVYDSDSKSLKKGLFAKHLNNIKKNNQKYIYPRNIVGGVTRDNNFYDREDVIQKLWQILPTKNIFLSAPRRFGKTSIMYYLYDNPIEDWRVVHLELQHIASPEKFVAKLQQSLSDTQSEKSPTNDTWKDDGKRFIETISQKRILFLFDEFLYMLENFKENELISDFSKWFLDQRQIANPNCRFLIASSNSLGFCLKQYGIKDDFSDFEKIIIPPFSPVVALGFIDELLLSENKRLATNLKTKILALVGGNAPYFIQIILTEILNCKKPLTDQEIENIYRERILGPDCKHYFHYFFFQRISRQDFELPQIAYRLLKELSACEYLSYSQLLELSKEISGKGDVMEFEGILAYLEDEFYINCDNGNYSFSCNVLKDWWKKHGREM